MGKALSRLSHFSVLVLVTAAANPNGLAQTSAQPQQTPQTSTDTTTSLADVVRNSKAQKNAHAKKVLTDEDMEISAGPLPRLRMDGAENAGEVIAAITAYKA